jgi:hypothetical protein
VAFLADAFAGKPSEKNKHELFNIISERYLTNEINKRITSGTYETVKDCKEHLLKEKKIEIESSIFIGLQKKIPKLYQPIINDMHIEHKNLLHLGFKRIDILFDEKMISTKKIEDCITWKTYTGISMMGIKFLGRILIGDMMRKKIKSILVGFAGRKLATFGIKILSGPFDLILLGLDAYQAFNLFTYTIPLEKARLILSSFIDAYFKALRRQLSGFSEKQIIFFVKNINPLISNLINDFDEQMMQTCELMSIHIPRGQDSIWLSLGLNEKKKYLKDMFFVFGKQCGEYPFWIKALFVMIFGPELSKWLFQYFQSPLVKFISGIIGFIFMITVLKIVSGALIKKSNKENHCLNF